MVERIDEETFSITLPDGNKNTYKISDSSESILISTSNYSEDLIISNFSFGLVLFTILLQFLMIFDDLRGLKATTRLFIQAGCTGGLIFLILAIIDFMNRYRGWEKTWGFLSLGLIMFIPGSFSTYTLTGAYLGWRGFSYDQVPSYDD